MTSPRITVSIGTDTSAVSETCRIIARHLTALADELDLQACRDAPEPLVGDTAAGPSIGVIRSGQP